MKAGVKSVSFHSIGVMIELKIATASVELVALFCGGAAEVVDGMRSGVQESKSERERETKYSVWSGFSSANKPLALP